MILSVMGIFRQSGCRQRRKNPELLTPSANPKRYRMLVDLTVLNNGFASLLFGYACFLSLYCVSIEWRARGLKVPVRPIRCGIIAAEQ